jgi:hypothetical protein
MRKRYVPVLCCLFAAASVGALDFGLALSQEAKASNEGAASADDVEFFYTPVASPWISAVGKKLSFYFSGSAGFAFEKDTWRTPLVLPELTRTELTWTVSPAFSFTLGRQHFADPSGLAAAGLFDGLAAAFSAGGSRFSVGAWYTGLLYKDTADIVMTSRDLAESMKPFALDGSYFASRRILASLQWEHPGLTPASSLALGLLGQADINDDDEANRFHSQYLSARWGLRLSGSFSLEALAALGAGEKKGLDPMLFFAGALGFGWMPPSSVDDTLRLRALYSSPRVNDQVIAFVPVNSLPQGQVFGPALGGVSVIKLAYTLRPLTVLSLGAEGSYFIRVDTTSFRDTRDALKEDGYFLGAEAFGTVLWMPLPDIALTLGGGAFFPRLGNAFTEDAETRWKATLKLILSL